jgi:hypothetical protein
MDNHKLWNLIQEAYDLLRKRYEPVIEQARSTTGLDLRTWGLLVSVYITEPEGITPADLMVRNPYTSADAYIARLGAAAGSGFLEEIRPNCYRLTGSGQTAALGLIETARSKMAQMDPLLGEDAHRLASYLHRLVVSCMTTEPPPETWATRASYKLMPADAPPMPYIEQCLTCLGAYRQDSHLAAWMISNLSATAFEMLTLFWRNEAGSLDEAFARLSYRGHPRVVYERSFEELWERGYIYGDESKPHLTEEGRLFRNQVEFDTDRYFFEAWGCLSEVEKFELGGLLIRLRDGLKAF